MLRPEYSSAMTRDANTTSIRLQSAVILIVSFVLLALGFGTLLARASLGLEGTIIQSNTSCDPSNQARCSTRYVVQSPGSTVSYSAGPNEQSLQRFLPVGTTISKKRWQLVYTVNGMVVDDFGTGPAIAIGGVGLLLFAASCILIVRPTIIPLRLLAASCILIVRPTIIPLRLRKQLIKTRS
jgi:hypothetical protein